MILLLLACAGPAAEPSGCVPDPVYTWETFGAGFIAGRCQGCHGTYAPERYGAPAALVFDTEAQVASERDAILRTVLETASMPPGGGLTDLEKERLARWLACP